MIAVRKPGLLTTVQDAGRPGHRASGMPVAGAMDRLALAAANRLVGNGPGAAALEFTLVGGTFSFEEGAVAALAGAEMPATLDGAPVDAGAPFTAPAGSTLTLGVARRGVRAYLAVAGGIDVAPVLGSRSTYLRAAVGGFEGRALRAGDRLPVGPPPARAAPRPSRPLPGLPAPGSTVVLRVIPGPQDDRFAPEGIETLLAATWKVTTLNDRMGYRLDGPAVRLRDGADIVTDAVVPGAVQVSGDGKPMVLMADCQTTGGYAKPFTVIGPDLRLLAQARAGDGVRFAICTQEEAVAALAEERAWPSI
ncbi:MAG: biotin-dependent carboxyltransferase family protein [Deltaproteobacteria bacterium]